MVLADHAADRGGRPDAGAPFERVTLESVAQPSRISALRKAQTLFSTQMGKGSSFSRSCRMGTCPSPKMLKGLRLTPPPGRPSRRCRRTPRAPVRRGCCFPTAGGMQASASFFEKMLRVLGGLDREGGPGDRLPAQVGDRDDVPVVVQAHRDGIFIGAVDVQGAFLAAGALGFAAVRLDQQALLDEIVADGRQRLQWSGSASPRGRCGTSPRCAVKAAAPRIG